MRHDNPGPRNQINQVEEIVVVAYSTKSPIGKIFEHGLTLAVHRSGQVGAQVGPPSMPRRLASYSSTVTHGMEGARIRLVSHAVVFVHVLPARRFL